MKISYAYCGEGSIDLDLSELVSDICDGEAVDGDDAKALAISDEEIKAAIRAYVEACDDKEPVECHVEPRDEWEAVYAQVRAAIAAQIAAEKEEA